MKRFLGGLAAALYVVACFLPGEPSGGERVEFHFDFAVPYRVPLAGTAQPPLRISAGGQPLSNPPYRLETLDPIVRVDPTGRGLEGTVRGTTSVRLVYETATATVDTVFPVQVVVSRIAVGPPAASLTNLGATTQLSATAHDAKDAAVPDVAFTWSSAAPQVATVNETGVVRAVDEGTVAITAEADGVQGLASITVTQVAEQVLIAPEMDTLRTVGRSTRFFAVAFDDTGGVIRTARPLWTSSEVMVATVDGAGRATATGAGTTRIIARVGEAADTAFLVVAQVVRFLVVTPGDDTLTAIADTSRLAGVAFDSLNFPISNLVLGWTTSDAAVATVDEAGLVRAQRNGVVLITASVAGQAASATVLVRQDVVAARIAEENVTLTGAGATLRLSGAGLDRNGYEVSGAAFTWRSGSECVASVDGAGLITAQGGGETLITAAPVNGGQSDTVVVSVTNAPAGDVDIAFVSPRGIEALCSGVGGGLVVLIPNGLAYEVGYPSWSPDGSRLAFTRTDDGWRTCAVYVSRADGSGAQKRTDGIECDLQAAWSPDGSRLAFASGDIQCQADCFVSLDVVNIDGSGRRRLLDRIPTYEDYGWYTNPTWSPDGAKLAFENYVHSCYDVICGHSEISIVNADGTGWEYLTRFPREALYDDNTEPAWSPDGSRIAFARLGDIWLMNTDGSDGRNLTSTAGEIFQGPAWSPDGSRLVFSRFVYTGHDGSPDLYIINRDGTGLQRLTSTPEYESNPTWRAAAPPAGSLTRASARRPR